MYKLIQVYSWIFIYRGGSSIKNYIDYECEVRIVNNILANKDDWDFLVKYINKNFDLVDITSWDEFLNINNEVNLYLYEYFMQISNYTKYSFDFENDIFNDLLIITKFENNRMCYQECNEKLKTLYGELRLFVQWINRELSYHNSTECVFNIGIFNIKNFWELCNLKGIQANEDFVIRELGKIKSKINGVPNEIFINNLEHRFYESNEEFLKKYELELCNVNSFNYTNCQLDYGTWQEYYLLDMLNVSFKNREIQPLFTIEDNEENIYRSKWTEDVLKELKCYFSNEISDFVIETISFVLYGNEMSKKIKIKHIDMLLEYIKKGKSYKIINFSSFKIISYIFEDKLAHDVLECEKYIELLKNIHSEEDIEMIQIYKDYSYPINKRQNKELKKYYRTKYEEINDVVNSLTLSQYLNDKNIAKEIEQEYFEKLKNTFREIVNRESGLEIASLFIEYMEFLNQLSENHMIERQTKQIEIIEVQRLWQKKYYEEQLSNLNAYRQEVTIPDVEVNSINQLLLSNPLAFLYTVFSTKDNKLIQYLETISSKSWIQMVTKTEIKYQFPERVEINIKRNSIDKLFAEKIDEILKNKEYEFLNILSVENYLQGIYEGFKHTSSFISSIVNLEKLYNKVNDMSEYPLIKYRENILVGHLTQLFPLLEIKIRNLSKNMGISPYKNNMIDFMKYNDPSTLLKQMIKKTYRETNSFENIPDLIFVYNSMYNNNSLNIRNEAIHGREYIYGDDLRSALIMTLISILAINYKIVSISGNKR